MARKVSDEAMIKATGHGPDHWYPILDEIAKDTSLERKEIVTKLWKTHEDQLSGWWAQMTTVEWERERGRRELNQSCTGDWQMSTKKTYPGDAMAEWDAIVGTDWLDGLRYEEGYTFSNEGVDFVVRAVRPGKLLRVWWTEAGHKSTLEVMFVPSKTKCAIRFQHQKLGLESDVERFKARWKDALGSILQS